MNHEEHEGHEEKLEKSSLSLWLKKKANRHREFEELSRRVIGCAIEVHRTLGPGLLESTYEQCLAHELALNKIAFQLQKPVAVEYKNIRLDCGYKVDVMVEDTLILELKSVEHIKDIH